MSHRPPRRGGRLPGGTRALTRIVFWCLVVAAATTYFPARAYLELPRQIRLLPEQVYQLPKNPWFMAALPMGSPLGPSPLGSPEEPSPEEPSGGASRSGVAEARGGGGGGGGGASGERGGAGAVDGAGAGDGRGGGAREGRPGGEDAGRRGKGPGSSAWDFSSLRLWRGRAVPDAVSFAEVGAAPLQLEWRFLGIIPVAQLRVEAVPEVSVIPGGQAIGVLMNGEGLVVNHTAPVVDVHGQRRYPAQDAGILAGDTITQVDGRPVGSPLEVARLVQEAGRRGRPLRLTLVRGRERLTLDIHPVPVFDGRTGNQRYMLGLFLQDPVAGVGTLTFYHPVTRRYGALGHVVTNSRQDPLPMARGEIVAATIQGVQRGARGRPGEKIGSFDLHGARLGSIDKNNQFGIFGQLEGDFPLRSPYGQPVPVAMAHEVETGPATMLTVLSGDRVEAFDVEITRVLPQGRRDGRGLVLRIVDPRLLVRTEGIIQGMSGSPLLQKGRLIGAVTHVFVNDPSRGYGTMAEWMVYEAGIAIREPDGGSQGEPGRMKAAG